MPKPASKTRMLTESAVMVALATVLSMIKILTLPQGGSITAASMVPLLIISFRYGPKWGTFTAFVYSLVNMMMGFWPPPVPNFINYLLVILLDYVVAFSCLGLASLFAKAIPGNRIAAIGFGSGAAVFIRLVCHVLSGGESVWKYSIGYNGSYMFCELIVSVVVMCLLSAVMDFKTLKRPVKTAKA